MVTIPLLVKTADVIKILALTKSGVNWRNYMDRK